jgi:hypothetical protein
MAQEERLIPVFLPSLAAILLAAERKKGSPLTPEEVIAIRDQGVCIMMRESHLLALEERRGYRDIDPENSWEEWQHVRKEMSEGEPP